MTFNPPLPAAFRADTAAMPRWLSIVGIGEDGSEGLSPVARGLISDAEFVFGGRRHLGLAAPLIQGAAKAWPSPFDTAVSEVLRHRGHPVCVLASGDPLCYGVGATLAREIVRKPLGAAESAAADRNRQRNRGGSAPGKRQRNIEAGAPSKPLGQAARFGRAAEYEDTGQDIWQDIWHDV